MPHKDNRSPAHVIAFFGDHGRFEGGAVISRRVYLMRHADVSYVGPEGRPLQPDGVPLTPEGRKQAGAASAALIEIPFDRVVSSGLPRTLETARLVVQGRGIEVESDPAFEEIRPGRVEEIPPLSLRDIFLSALDRPRSPTDRFLGGETWGSLEARVLPAFDRLLGSPGWANLLLVAHGGVNRLILLRALGLSLSGLGLIEQDPCALNILDLSQDGRLLVRLLNHTVHDPGKATLKEGTMERLLRSLTSRPGE
ncbi:MAG TPA: histidine phosphatase family protein [Vicinamibacteria bacterium]|jgi:broad specificity phosphatase PhoE|nr:histidine phosphatase family protein [Vicinamibacteria bacterium]